MIKKQQQHEFSKALGSLSASVQCCVSVLLKD